MKVVRPAISSVFTVVPCKLSLNRRSSQPVRKGGERSSVDASDLRLSTASTPQEFYCYFQGRIREGWQRPFEVLANLLTAWSGTRTKWIMLLYTKNANNVFGFVYEKFGFRDISPLVSSPAGWLPQVLCTPRSLWEPACWHWGKSNHLRPRAIGGSGSTGANGQIKINRLRGRFIFIWN
ncbi:hypothetical protein D3C84_847910 [compost metagenome]